MTEALEIRKGDKVQHRETGKLGTVLEVLNEGHYWQDDLATATPFKAWMVVRWRREQRPTVESVTDLIRLPQERS